MTAYFKNAVLGLHARSKTKGAAFPEVRVEEIWAGYDGPVPEGWPREKRKLALYYELTVNPVYPMPDALETITVLREQGCVLGIISNAQFFSPLLFNAFFGKPPAALGFDPRLLLWSFAEGEAKPSPRLFEKAAAVLSASGIRRGQALFVGNDMRSDIVPAAAAGFIAVLFAGDKRSLRTRGLLPKPGVPAAVIGNLRSLGSLQFVPCSR
jgi:putative hydrolase of the HAD superfamily